MERRPLVLIDCADRSVPVNGRLEWLLTQLAEVWREPPDIVALITPFTAMRQTDRDQLFRVLSERIIVHGHTVLLAEDESDLPAGYLRFARIVRLHL